MKSKILISLLLVVIVQVSYAQNRNFEAIANEICNRFNGLENKTGVKPNDPSYLKCINDGYLSKGKEVQDELKRITEAKPSKSQQGVLLEIGREVTQILMRNCISFQNITMGNVNGTEFKSPAIIELGNMICNCIEKKSKTGKITNIIVDDCIVDWTNSSRGIVIIEKEVNLDDDKETNNFGDRLGKYLMTDCTIYAKWMTSKIK